MGLKRVHKRHSETMGWYQPNNFLIVLGSATPFLEVTIKGDVRLNYKKYLAVFLHEYWHFLQNTTTVAGFITFLHSQLLLHLFGKTLAIDSAGKVYSKGNSALSPEEIAKLLAVLELDHALHGDTEPPEKYLRKEIASWTITNLIKRKLNVTWENKPLDRHHLVLDLKIDYSDSTSDSSATLSIGSAAIEESLAYLVERQLAQKDPSLHVELSPDFPYTVLEHVFDYLVGINNEPLYVISALGTISLMTNDPAGALFEILTFYKELRNRKLSPMSALNAILSNFGPIIHRSMNSVQSDHLASIQAMHAGRGLLEIGSNEIINNFRTAFALRSDYVLFDLDFATRSTVDEMVASVSELTSSLPSCDVLQERIGDEHKLLRDFMVASQFAGGGTGSVSDGIRALQSQQHFMLLHLGQTGFIETSQLTGSPYNRCPYYTACNLQYRKNNPNVCDDSPWRNYTKGSSEDCWYGHGVSGSVSLIKLGKKV